MQAIILDDVAIERQLVARLLQRSGWIVHTARDSKEALQLVDRLLAQPGAEPTVIITDLDMPADPLANDLMGNAPAGAHFALLLRARMERGELQRSPIVALTGLSEREILLTARAFGCDLVLAKPAQLDLAQQISDGWQAAQANEADAVGVAPLLQLLRARLARAVGVEQVSSAEVSEAEITRALLAYRRAGPEGLGETDLARRMAPAGATSRQRGEHLYGVLLNHVNAVLALGEHEAHAILQGELIKQASPAEQSRELGLSLSEYYRRRREAILTLIESLASAPPSARLS